VRGKAGRGTRGAGYYLWATVVNPISMFAVAANPELFPRATVTVPDPPKDWETPALDMASPEATGALPVVLRRRIAGPQPEAKPAVGTIELEVVDAAGKALEVTHFELSGCEPSANNPLRPGFPRGVQYEKGTSGLSFRAVPTGTWRAWVRSAEGRIGLLDVTLKGSGVGLESRGRLVVDQFGSIKGVGPKPSSGTGTPKWTVSYGLRNMGGVPSWAIGGDPGVAVKGKVSEMQMVATGQAFHFSDVVPGDYWLTAYSDNECAVTTFRVEAGAAMQVSLAALPFGRLRLDPRDEVDLEARYRLLLRHSESGTTLAVEVKVDAAGRWDPALFYPGGIDWYLIRLPRSRSEKPVVVASGSADLQAGQELVESVSLRSPSQER